MKENTQSSSSETSPKMAESMMEAYEAKRNKQTSRIRSIMDFGIGTLVILVGVFLFVRDKFTLAFNEKFPPDEKDKYIGVIFFLYGAWRVYRGIKKIQ